MSDFSGLSLSHVRVTSVSRASPSRPSANAAKSTLNEAHLKAERLFDRLKPLQTLGENLSRNLSEIRELINQARKQAASVSLASCDLSKSHMALQMLTL